MHSLKIFRATRKLETLIFHLLNGHIGKWPFFDHALHAVTDDLFLRGAVVFFLFWAVWFKDASTDIRARLLSGLLATCVATVASVALQHHLMIHVRPLLDTDLDKRLSSFVDMSLWTTPSSFAHKNSFPSDTATMYFALALTIFNCNRRLGAIALAWTLFAIALPRIYFAYHYPSDIAGGFLLALAVQFIFQRIHLLRDVAGKFLLSFNDKAYLLHPLMFLFVMDMANLFVGVRHVFRVMPMAVAFLR